MNILIITSDSLHKIKLIVRNINTYLIEVLTYKIQVIINTKNLKKNTASYYNFVLHIMM